jgi:hypothetical protein
MQRWLVLALLVLTACGHSVVTPDAQNIASKKGVVSAWADWVKPKGKKYDMRFHFKNESTGSIIVKSSDVSCFRGAVQGEMHYTFFNTGERTIDLGVGQNKGANMVCSFPAVLTGDFKVTIARVFDNPSNDGKTAVNVIANDLVWQQSDSNAEPR